MRIGLIVLFALFSFSLQATDYEMKFPHDWRVKRDFMGLELFASAAQPSRANISVVSAPMEGELTLDALFNLSLNHLKSGLRDVKLLETGQVFLDGVSGRKVVYNHVMGDVPVSVAQYFALKNGRRYVITCTAQSSEFQQMADTFERAVRSFAFK